MLIINDMQMDVCFSEIITQHIMIAFSHDILKIECTIFLINLCLMLLTAAFQQRILFSSCPMQPLHHATF